MNGELIMAEAFGNYFFTLNHSCLYVTSSRYVCNLHHRVVVFFNFRRWGLCHDTSEFCLSSLVSFYELSLYMFIAAIKASYFSVYIFTKSNNQLFSNHNDSEIVLYFHSTSALLISPFTCVSLLAVACPNNQERAQFDLHKPITFTTWFIQSPSSSAACPPSPVANPFVALFCVC